MKKTLAAVAVLGALAGSAMAAEVTLYGVIDTGLNWTQVKKANKTTDSFSMGSGQNSGPRFGLKGTEDLGDGWKVGFNLENSFKSDTGALESAEDGGRLFHREALLFVQSPYMGRTGALDAGTGRYNLMGSGATAMGTGWDNVGKSTVILKGTNSRMDNTVTYQSPSFAGLTVYAQASLQKDSCDPDIEYKNYPEGSSDAERYYGLGVKFAAEGLNAGLVFSTTDYSRQDVTKDNDDDGYVVSGFVNYDFGMVKPMLAAQYWDGGDKLTFKTDTATTRTINGTKGYGIVIGATAPVLGGTFYAQANYLDSETNAKSTAKTHITGSYVEGSVATDVDYTSPAYTADKFEAKNWGIALGYAYPFSKRTNVYTYASYNQLKLTAKADGESAYVKNKVTEVGFGLKHSF